MLRQLSYFNAEENDTKSQTKYLNSSECVAENEHDKVTPVKKIVAEEFITQLLLVIVEGSKHCNYIYGISVGVLTSDNIKCDAKEAADGTLQLKLTPIDSGLSIQHVSCGLEHTVLLSQHGGIFTFGCGSRGQLGHGALESESQPRMVEDLEGMRCVCVAAGGWHSAAISIDGDLYMWGWNESGQLGLPSPAIQQKKCKQMQEDEQREEHQHGCSLHLCPEYVPIGSESIILVAAACGTRHTAVLSGCGKVFTAGWNRYGQLGHHHANNMDKFLPVHFSDIETTVQQVWCGAWNTAFLLTDIKS
ncbi:RCC1 domain-containing protein 1-like [Pomacea canaliculata]|uniref:RCC1 domain-containing protein 1-like n=1 Tax=Pomacea canaliculata TaxID=400727 RepID=UPI000D73083A|nr:RCC1 domain-containing protein 1-like [Pomacea canaliculata]